MNFTLQWTNASDASPHLDFILSFSIKSCKNLYAGKDKTVCLHFKVVQPCEAIQKTAPQKRSVLVKAACLQRVDYNPNWTARQHL